MPKSAANRSQADKWRGKAEEACEHAVQTQIMLMLEASALGVLGKHEQTRFEFLKDPQTLSRISCLKASTNVKSGIDTPN